MVDIARHDGLAAGADTVDAVDLVLLEHGDLAGQRLVLDEQDTDAGDRLDAADPAQEHDDHVGHAAPIALAEFQHPGVGIAGGDLMADAPLQVALATSARVLDGLLDRGAVDGFVFQGHRLALPR